MTDQIARRLLACPFCGSPAELERDNDHHGEWFNLGCSRHWGNVDPDDACIGGRVFYTEDPEKEASAIEAWNTRALSQQQRPTEDEIVAAALGKKSADLLEGLCAWLLHRFGPDSPEGHEAAFRQPVARAAIEALSHTDTHEQGEG